MERNKNVRFSAENSFEISQHVRYINDYEDGWENKSHLENHLREMQDLKVKLSRSNTSSDIRAEQRHRDEKMRIDEAQQEIIKQLEYMRNRHMLAEVEKAKIAEDYRRLEDARLKNERERESRAEFTRKLQQEAYYLRCSRAITKPFVFSYYYEKGNRKALNAKKSKKK